jgi:hypothetical protein
MDKTADFSGDASPLLLERHWEIEAVVEHGDARGRTMGFPTANFVAFLRPEASFSDLDALITQIRADAQQASELLTQALPLTQSTTRQHGAVVAAAYRRHGVEEMR